MKKYLFVSNNLKPSYGELISREKIRLDNFSIPNVEAALSMGYQVYIGIDRINPEELECDYDVKFYFSSIYRSLFDIKSNYTAYKNLMGLLKRGKIDVIHCNTPIGGLLGRLCGKFAGVPKVIYTVHGFHFYKGAPLINRTLFKWAEMWLAHYTDAIITINHEDYKAAQRFKLRNGGKVYYVPGVGVDISVIKEVRGMREGILKDIGADDNSILMISVGDLNKNKNNEAIIKALGKLRNPGIHYLLCGTGAMENELCSLVKDCGLERNVHFLGYHTDIPELLKSCNIFVIASYREGLPRSMMEAMAAGLPCIASKIRGNTDLIEEGKGGYLRSPEDIEGLAEAINTLVENEDLRKSMSLNNIEIIKKFDVEIIRKEIKDIYKNELQ